MPISERVVEQKILVAVDFGKYTNARNVTSIQLGSLNIRYYILRYCLGPNRRGKLKHLTSSTTDGQLLFLRPMLKISYNTGRTRILRAGISMERALIKFRRKLKRILCHEGVDRVH